MRNLRSLSILVAVTVLFFSGPLLAQSIEFRDMHSPVAVPVNALWALVAAAMLLLVAGVWAMKHSRGALGRTLSICLPMTAVVLTAGLVLSPRHIGAVIPMISVDGPGVYQLEDLIYGPVVLVNESGRDLQIVAIDNECSAMVFSGEAEERGVVVSECEVGAILADEEMCEVLPDEDTCMILAAQ